MRKSAILAMPRAFGAYIAEAGDGELADELALDLDAELDLAQLRRRPDHAYASGKWTAAAVVQHLVDTERIFAYRALRFARGDRTPLPGFDENSYAAHAGASGHGDAPIEELRVVRRATALMFAGFDETMLLRSGTCAGIDIQVLALGFAIVGHARHHLHVLRSRYLTA
jgi:hypothetical protein